MKQLWLSQCYFRMGLWKLTLLNYCLWF